MNVFELTVTFFTLPDPRHEEARLELDRAPLPQGLSVAPDANPLSRIASGHYQSSGRRHGGEQDGSRHVHQQ